jgi:hypothetical protein
VRNIKINFTELFFRMEEKTPLINSNLFSVATAGLVSGLRSGVTWR